MTLVDVDYTLERTRIPDSIADFLHEANIRTNDYLTHSRVRVSGFVPSDFVCVYWALRAVVHENMASGNLFCEWGSGFGVVASLASLLGFDSYGIEIDERLVDASRDLVYAQGLPVEFAHGSFVPPEADSIIDEEYASESFWLDTETANDAYDELEIAPDEFDVVFAYPWPNEETAVGRLFDRCAAEGALLLTYTQLDEVRIRRKLADADNGSGASYD